MAKGDKEPLPIYESEPPEWLPKIHATADLGYIGFYPPRPNEEEELLTERNVRDGLAITVPVLAESYSAQDNVRNRLAHENGLSELEELMSQIFARRAENVPPIPPSTFRMPSRVTLNDTKRQAWFADLANPEVPLYKLGKNVPHGAKGHDLLDLLHTNNVAIPRAVWFLRVFGGNETTGLRNKPMYNPTQYSVDWANVVTSYMKKQLADIALPSAPRPGLNIKQTFKGVLADPESRARWISRFTYCLSLLRTFYAEGLVDNRTFLAWLVQQMGNCNLAQLGFVARLADEYLEGMLVSRAFTRPFVDACLHKLSELRTTFAKDHLGNVDLMLGNLISRCFLALPDAFVSPRTWISYSKLLEEILLEDLAIDPSDSTSAQNAHILHQTFTDHFADVKSRNEAMLFRHLPPRTPGGLSSNLADIKLLNSLSGKTAIDTVVFFTGVAEFPVEFVHKLDTLLTWSVTSLQYGDHRPYAAACLLREWRIKAGERAIRHDVASPDDQIQDQLFDWLDTSDDAANPAHLCAVSLLFGQLVKRGLFSYQKYIQRLIARGEPGLSFAQEVKSRHQSFLRWIPLHDSCSSLINQRKVTLYGVRARETPEDLNEREIRREIRALLPELFGGSPQSTETITTTFWSSCNALLSSPRFEQVRMIKQWFLPVLRRSISSHMEDTLEPSETSAGLLKTYTLATVLMARVRCYGSMLDLTLFTLEHTYNHDLLTVVIETIRQHMEIWACMNVMKTLAGALYAAHQLFRTRGVQTRALLTLLIEVDNERHLEPTVREQILADISAYTRALYPINQRSDAVPLVLPEILLLATDPNPEAPSNLAKSLWYKYMTAADWAWKVWDNTIASLRQIPVMIEDVDGRRVCALRYANFLSHVDQHLPRGFDDQVLEWFLGSGKNEVAALSADAWDVVSVVLLHLSVCGALTTTSILRGLIYPVWGSGATAVSVEQGQALEVCLAAVNTLFEHLLLKDECGTGLPPMDLFQAQGLQTRRRDVFREPHFSSLIENLPSLVLVEQNQYLSDPLRQSSSSLRQNIGVYCDLDTVRRAFERLLECRDIPDMSHEPLVAALRLMLHDPGQGATSDNGFQVVSSLLSPWKLAATAIEIRLTLKQLGEGLSRETTRATADATLDKVAAFVFQSCRPAEVTDFVAEMMTEVSRDVASKFLNAGLSHMTAMLNGPYSLSKADGMVQFVDNAGEILRLLAKIVERFRDDASLPQLTPPTAFDHVAQVRSESEDCSQTAIFLARLLQFDLGFPGAWTTRAKTLIEELCSALHMLALLPVFELSDLPPDMPPEFRTRLRTLLPYVAPNVAVSDLAYTTRDSSCPQPVQNRPWEWTEHLGDAPAGIDEQHASPRNTTSLALELVGARATGDALVHMRGPSARRTCQDDFGGESVFARDWRETRVRPPADRAGTPRAAREDSPAPGPPRAGTVSPVSSVRTRAGSARTHSAPSSAGSLRPSPAHPPSRLSVSTAGEPIDVDALDGAGAAGRSAKRKTSEDDEVEIVEGPVAARPAKKTKTKVAAKTRAKKR
ncbi:hypothetical protein B0H21DRAFT_744154 [Amylocystis lapponica]|nr:hypothetical protein B0H21DRAFT_744154 [Amylocystis lapponica]